MRLAAEMACCWFRRENIVAALEQLPKCLTNALIPGWGRTPQPFFFINLELDYGFRDQQVQHHPRSGGEPGLYFAIGIKQGRVQGA